MNLSKIKIEKSLIGDDLFIFRINDSLGGHIHKSDLEDLFKSMVLNDIGKNYLNKRFMAMNKKLFSSIRNSMMYIGEDDGRARGILVSILSEVTKYIKL